MNNIYRHEKRRKSGEGTITKQGYKIITVNGKQVREHRYVMEQYLDRKLSREEIVHHIDESKSNNDISNLVIMSRPEHKKHHSDIGMATRFQSKHHFTGEYAYNLYLKLKDAQLVGKVLNCSENTVRRAVKSFTGKSLTDIAEDNGWPYRVYRHKKPKARLMRHGENLLIQVDKFPKGKIKKSKSLIVGHSETGHHHVLESKYDIESVEMKNLFFRIANPAELVHKKTIDKHKTITVEPGIYKVIPKTEYDPWGKTIRRVFD